MIYTFGDLKLDIARQELLRHGVRVDVEPMVFQLIHFLIENRERLVSKEELFSLLWNDRAVSDSALSTCIKSARRAVGDTGNLQEVIKTIHGKGFRWIAQGQSNTHPTVKQPLVDLDGSDDAWAEAAQRPSIAILPFETIGTSEEARTLGEAIPHELIATIARLRWISVIARGSSFRFRSSLDDFGKIHQSLGVKYCVTGTVEVLGRQVSIGVVLTDTEDGEVIWADQFRAGMDDIHEVRENILAQVIFAVEVQIPLSEATKARLRSPENIDVWATYHLGLQSLYKFEANENDMAISRFEKAISLEPSFARAHAALSFSHFKTAFMHYSDDRDRAVKAARAAAERAIELDPMDPFANFSMGRSLWLVGDLEAAKSWLNRSTTLSPNFAQGIYARAWTETVSGDTDTGRRLSDEARVLSPLDPMLYAMLGTRAMSHAIDENYEEAADWGVRAANAPGAHDLIAMIAVFTNELAGNHNEAADWAKRLRSSRLGITQEHFFRSFPFSDSIIRQRFSSALSRHNIPET
ncbi:winged helix-turn-helix domain-containing tetratricopeptide repeat protein [Ruegeria sp.]|uniref:winged helix-turn-helix domain-containing tetratricopeptide repeat protein n=1 Tax=Ruegeria sp. TaxID=1879320 RepID=UPI003B5990EB